MAKKKATDLFSSKPKKKVAKPEEKAEQKTKKRGRRPIGKFKPATSEKVKPETPTEKETREGISRAETIDAKTTKKSSYLDLQKTEYLEEVDELLRKQLPLTNANSHTISNPAQNSVEIRRDKDGNLAFTVKFYGRDIGDTVKGAMAMLVRVDYNLREYERERKAELTSGETKVKGRNIK